ncbi:MAG: beta-ketoacyl-ACP synthase II [Clostridiales bacterium]|nr:beta-ketoacyl-ACP synthase II [Clostridiales bacterium]
MAKRVVITGLGAVTPLGNNVPDFWEGLKSGKCGISLIDKFDTSDLKAKVAGQVKDFNADGVIGKKEQKRLDNFCQYAMVAADECMKDSGVDTSKENAERFGVIIGSGIGGLATIEETVIKMHTGGARKVSPFFIPMAITNMAAGNVAIQVGAKGICTCIVTACATSTHAVGEAFRNIKHGYSDMILAGGAEAPVTRIGVAGFCAARTLTGSEDPLKASTPFDLNRSGFVMGEGAGVLLLEELEHAKARGAKIYGEVVGYGATDDAYHITAPREDGEGARLAMKAAIEEAGVETVDYINAHGTSTALNDKMETRAIKDLFGEKAYDISISSTKSMTGHLLGATGAIEAIATTLAVKNGFVPPTIGYSTPDPDLDLDYTVNKGKERDIKYAISNTLGFGGHNGVICIKKWEE